MSNVIQVNMPPLYPKQLAAFFNRCRYSVIEASTKAGKTLGALVWQGAQVMRDGTKRNHWWIAPVYSQAAIAYRRAKEMYRGLYEANDSEMRLTFHNGASWWFKSGEKPDNLYGEDVASAVIDEFTRVREEAWHAVRSTLTYTRGQVRLIGNVKGRANWGYQIARRAESGQDGYTYHKIVAADAVAAGVLAQSEIDDAKRALPEQVYRELYECVPADDGGNPFGLAAIRRQVRPLSTRTPVAFGVDLAKSHDWTVVCGLDDAGQVCTLERWQSDWGQTRSRVLALVNGWQTLIDSTGVGDPIVEDLTKVRGNIQGFRFSSPSKQQLMEGLASAIHTGEVAFPDGWLVSELEAFEYEYTRTGVRYSAPDGLHDDGVCALALAVKCLRENARVWCGVVQIQDEPTDDDE
jgi:phage FluMu gp28-like protein